MTKFMVNRFQSMGNILLTRKTIPYYSEWRHIRPTIQQKDINWYSVHRLFLNSIWHFLAVISYNAVISHKMFKFIYENVFKTIIKERKVVSPCTIIANIKKVLNNKIEISLNESMKRAWQLLYDHNLIIRKVEDYVQGKPPSIERIIPGITITIMCLLIIVRFTSIAFVDNYFIQILMNDSIDQIVGDRKTCMMFSFLIAWSTFVTLSVFLLIIYHDLKNKFKCFKYIFNLIENKPAIDLSYSRHRRLTLGLHLMTEYYFPFFYRSCLSSSFLMYTFLTFIYLPDGGSVLSILMALLWLTPIYIMLKLAWSIIFLWGIFWMICMIYVKYLFNTIEDNIELCLKCRNSKLVIKVIKQHRIAEQICDDMNELCKVFNFILYFLVSPMHIFFMNFIFDSNSPLITKIISTVGVITGYSLSFSVIFITSQITRSAHRPRKLFYRYLNSTSLPFNHRMKITSFTEYLCGPDIGFYCMDWFLMDSYEFYQYITYCGSLYIMGSSFVQTL